MGQLIAFRALQGIGGGGLIIGAQAIVGDVVAPRERGRYQGIFGAVFGVTSVLGPLLGGYIVEHLSWHWVFYVNLPIGAVALVVTGAVLPAALRRVAHAIDYAGTLLIGGAATALVLLTTLGGTTYPWLSAPIGLLGAAGVVLIAGFILVERRAAEPVLPLRLFRERVFSVASAIGFVVGFAMFGAITYLPQYLQVVRGATPTVSGLELLPLMAGLLLTSMGSGLAITRTGRYRIFPIVGTGLMTIGLALLSTLGVHTSTLDSSAYMFVLGIGIGAVMQVLVIAVQNVVAYRDLGAATSGATFFRSIGGSFGTAVFGAIFANRLAANLVRELAGVHVPAGFSASAGASPAALAGLPPVLHARFIAAYADAIHTVFLVAAPVAFVAFLLTFALRDVPLRQAARAPDQGQALAPSAVPARGDGVEEVSRILSVLARREERTRIYAELAAASGLALEPRAIWLLLRLSAPGALHLPALASRLGLDLDEACFLLDPLTRAGLVACRPESRRPETVALRPAGAEAIERLVAARASRLRALLGAWSEEADARLNAEVERLARDLLADLAVRGAVLGRDAS